MARHFDRETRRVCRILDARVQGSGRVRAFVCTLLFAVPAAGQPVSITTHYSPYEEQAIHDAEAALQTRTDPSPEGKRIERIDFVRIEPIDPHDPAPLAMNTVHVTSKPSVLRHELLVREGNVWSGILVDESARNLRLLPQLSLVLCVPMRGSAPGLVRLVVITKDVWSLYVDFDVEGTPGGLQLLDLEPKETNFAGLHQTVLGRFVLQPLSYTFGASYLVPRFDQRYLSVSVDANVLVNRASGSPEGHYGSAIVGRPLYSSRTEWAWETDVVWEDEIYRRYVNAAVDTFRPTAPASTLVPWAYRERTFEDDVQVVRSFGWQTKNDFAAGGSVSAAAYLVPENPLLQLAAVRQFEKVALPVSENRVGPFVQWHGYTSDFLRIVDFDTLALQEDYRLGHEVYLRVYPVLRALGSTQDLIGTYASVAYGARLGDGVARVLVESTIEAEASSISDAYLNAELALATPRILGVGRLVLDVTVLDRWRDHLNVLSFLGSDTRLRGYPTQFFYGQDMIVSNLEFRSRPVEIASLQFDATAFYDVGDAFSGLANLRPMHDVGVGLHVLFPQVTRSVLRIDVGFPVSESPLPAGVSPVSFYVTFGQALSLPTPSPPGASLPQ
jgi:hypothetical protein